MSMPPASRTLAVLGSTGSIGEQTLDVVAREQERVVVTALAAGRSLERLAAQCERWRPRWVALEEAADEAAARTRLMAASPGAEVRVGPGSAAALAADCGAEVVVNYRQEAFAPVVMEHTANKGADVVFDNVGEAVMDDSMSCLAYNGRYLMMGFASDKTVADEKSIVPRRIAMGNIKLCGVLLAYADPAFATMVKQGTGWNLPSNELGARINSEIIDLVQGGRVRAVVGKVVEFEDVPAAFDAMANRQTVGRTIVKLWDDNEERET